MARVNPWYRHFCRLERAIKRDGWTVETRAEIKDAATSDQCVGQIDYDKRTILVSLRQSAKEAFLTLCHEAGHKAAFESFGEKTEAAFRRHCPDRNFREYQACVHGWRIARRYTKRVTLHEWLLDNAESVMGPLGYSAKDR